MSGVASASGQTGDVWHDCVRSGCAGSHEAFRYWLVDPLEPVPLSSPYLTAQTRAWHGCPPGALTSRCVTGHSAPAGGCECGFRVMGSLSDLASAILAEYRLRTCLPPAQAARWEPDVFDRVAVGSVAAWGRIMRGAGADHAGVLRCEHVGVTGPLYLPATAAAAASHIRDTYSVEVVVERETGVRFMAGFLGRARRSTCQACGEPLTGSGLPGLCPDADRRVCARRQALRLRQGAKL